MIYAMSDIHGKYDWFVEMLNLINFSNNDELYIIGDVIDRGDKPIELLQYIMQHDNIHLMLGNHEYMMLGARHSSDDRYDWMCNGGRVTLEQWNKLNTEEKIKAYNYLEFECPIAIPNLKVDGHRFYLVHSTPEFNIRHTIYLNDIDSFTAYSLVWERRFNDEYARNYLVNEIEELKNYKGTVISGHTPMPYCWFAKKDDRKLYKISSAYDDKYINIDCGCAMNYRLGCLCLNNKEEFYIGGEAYDYGV